MFEYFHITGTMFVVFLGGFLLGGYADNWKAEDASEFTKWMVALLFMATLFLFGGFVFWLIGFLAQRFSE